VNGQTSPDLEVNSKKIRRSSLLFWHLAVALVFLPQLGRAVNHAWTGAGTDSFWSTGSNWGGTPLVGATTNNLIFSGSARLNNTNNLGNLTNGWLQFANGGFTLNSNSLTLNPPGAGIITNLAGTNTLAMPLNISPAGKVWAISAGSELRLTGAVTNPSPSGSSIGWLLLTNGGTVRIMNLAQSLRGIDLFQGSMIVDGGLVDANNDGIRFKVPASQTVTTLITNNGALRIGGGGNFRMGDTGSAAGSLSQLIVASGTLELFGANVVLYVSDRAGAPAVVNQNGGLVWGSAGSGNTVTFANTASGSDGTYNLNGGVLWIAQVRQANASVLNATFNFNGGTLKPTINSTVFFQGVTTANVQDGGAIIDTTNLNITIAQNLAAAGSGGLIKLGLGTLVLSGTNSYSGATVVSNGTLSVDGRLDGAGGVTVAGGSMLGGSGTIAGPVMVQALGLLSPGASVGTLTVQSNLTVAGNLWLEVNKSLAATNDFVQVNGLLTNAGAGTATISNLGSAFVVGESFKFFNNAMANGDALNISPASPGAGMAWTNKLAVDGTIGIVSAPLVATPADLIGLTLSAGVLSPAFSSNVLNYTASAAYSNSMVVLTPTAANPGAAIRVICNGVTNLVASGAASGPVLLKAGVNLIDVRVTAPDDSITKDYLVTFKRTPPNVVVALADDQGFTDWGCYGGEITTPNLDRLAAGGMRFRQFYNTARCSTTRCALLTGLYTHQVAVDPSQSLPSLRNDNNVTMAELLGANGYRTYMAGKWHLGGGALLPESRGFQQVWRFASGTSHSEDNWNSGLYTLVSTNGEITNRTYGAGPFYQTDAIGDYSVDFVNNNLVTHADGRPFLLYMAFGAAHFPVQAPQNWVNTNAPIYAAGWDVIRNARYANSLAKGAIDGRHLLAPNEGTAPWSSIGAEAIPAWNTLASDRQADLARRMAIYAAMVQKFDENIGKVVERLRTLGQLDNTLIFVMSDNGGNHEGAVFGQTGGVPNATPLTGSALTNMGLSGQPIIFLGGGWAHVNNTPFRLFKHFNHEGGIRSPMIVHWPQGISRTNQWTDQASHLIDVMATIVDATGVTYPTQLNNHAVLPLEGQSLQPQFNDTNVIARTLGFEHEGNRAWLSGSWKFVTKNFTSFDGSTLANQMELYNLSDDPVELTNHAPSQPALMYQMVTNWNGWAARVGVPSSRFVDTNALNQPVTVTPATNSNDLFVDSFNRPDNTNLDASSAGMWGSRVPPLGVNAAYYEGWEGSGLPTSIQVLNSNLQMAVGFGMAENGIMHNFTGQDIIDAGGFSVELRVQEINSATTDSVNRFVGFGVGLSQSEAAAGGDVGDPSPAVLFRGKAGNANLGVSDFFVELDIDGNIKVWNNGALLDTVPVGQNTGTLTASYSFSGFSTNDTVAVRVFFNGQLVDINTADTNSVGRTFKWDRDSSNYIGLSARASDYTQMDNLAIRKLPVAFDLAINHALEHGLTGTNSALGADPDGDEVNNFGEWAFGGDPTAADPSIATLTAALVTPARDFQFDHQRLINAANYGVQYRYLVSSNLQSWTETTPFQVAAATNEDVPAYEIVTLQLPVGTIAGHTKLFLRVLAEAAN